MKQEAKIGGRLMGRSDGQEHVLVGSSRLSPVSANPSTSAPGCGRSGMNSRLGGGSSNRLRREGDVRQTGACVIIPKLG
jgi:hypothetical protein